MDKGIKLIDVSEWNIFIDDTGGELCMDKRSDKYTGRYIEVLAKEEIMPLYKTLESKLQQREELLRDAIKTIETENQRTGSFNCLEFLGGNKDLIKELMKNKG